MKKIIIVFSFSYFTWVFPVLEKWIDSHESQKETPIADYVEAQNASNSSYINGLEIPDGVEVYKNKAEYEKSQLGKQRVVKEQQIDDYEFVPIKQKFIILDNLNKEIIENAVVWIDDTPRFSDENGK